MFAWHFKCQTNLFEAHRNVKNGNGKYLRYYLLLFPNLPTTTTRINEAIKVSSASQKCGGLHATLNFDEKLTWTRLCLWQIISIMFVGFGWTWKIARANVIVDVVKWNQCMHFRTQADGFANNATLMVVCVCMYASEFLWFILNSDPFNLPLNLWFFSVSF